MPRDQKVGMAILILVVGFGAAFCFRRQPEDLAALPALQKENEINRQIAELRTRPYLPGVDSPFEEYERQTAENPFVSELERLRPSMPEKTDLRPAPIGTVSSFQQYQARQEAKPEPVPEPEPVAVRLPPPPAPESAKPPTLPVSQAEPVLELNYRVQPGDTLSGIAYEYYRAASRYKEIFEANRDQLNGPNDLRPGMLIRIPGVKPPASREEIREAYETNRSVWYE